MNTTFHYFHGRGIGEPVRLLLTLGDVDFADRRYTIDEFAGATDFKARLPFGQTPALEIDGELYGQTDSVARLAAKLAGLYPEDPLLAARSDMIVVHQAEIQSAIAKMSFDGVPGAPGTKMLPEQERAARIRAWSEEALPAQLARLENLAGDGYMVGGALTWADVCVFNRINQLLDFDPKLLNENKKLCAVFNEVAAEPAIQRWLSEHPEDYPRGADARLPSVAASA